MGLKTSARISQLHNSALYVQKLTVYMSDIMQDKSFKIFTQSY